MRPNRCLHRVFPREELSKELLLAASEDMHPSPQPHFPMKVHTQRVFGFLSLLLLSAVRALAQLPVPASAPPADSSELKFMAGAPVPAGFPHGPRMSPEELKAWVAKARIQQDEYYAKLLGPLQNAAKVTLFSLDPSFNAPKTASLFQNFNILGELPLTGEQAQSAANAVASAINLGRPIVAENMSIGASSCLIEPRHGLRVAANGHTYDYLICFQCGQGIIYEDNQEIASINIGGRPTVLNNLLVAAKLPVDNVARMETEDKDTAQAAAAARTHMPKSLQDVWANHHDLWTGNFLADSRAALAAEFPEVTPRIRALLEYFGAEKSSFPASPFQLQAANLLVDYLPGQLVAAMQSGPLSDAQMLGAVRFVSTNFPDPAVNIPADLHAKLLAFAQKQGDRSTIQRMNAVFNRPPPDSSAPGKAAPGTASATPPSST